MRVFLHTGGSSCLSLTSVSRGRGGVTLPGSCVRALSPTLCPEGLSHIQDDEYKVQPSPQIRVHQEAGMTKLVKVGPGGVISDNHKGLFSDICGVLDDPGVDDLLPR